MGGKSGGEGEESQSEVPSEAASLADAGGAEGGRANEQLVSPIAALHGACCCCLLLPLPPMKCDYY